METSLSLLHQQKPTVQSKEKNQRSLSFQEISRGFSNLARRNSLRRTLGRPNTLSDGHTHTLNKTLAVSDGELNMLDSDERAGTQYSCSNSSLPTVPSEGSTGVGKVASWAVSFERLLEDPMGIRYFTAFLKSEVSAENILFWLACEKYRKIPAHQTEQLKKEALSIYNIYLSSNATSPINIDDRVRVEEKDVQNPHPDIFQKAQQQIFKLMKFDSYTRFVRSQLYQNCMLANVEGRPLPGLDSRGKPLALAKPTSTSPKGQVKADGRTKERLKVKPSTAESEDVLERMKVNLIGKDKRKEKRESWGEQSFSSKTGLKSSEAEKLVARSAEGRVDKYCCVFLPDGTASLTPARPGLTVRDMLTGLCEKRRLPLSDIIIYLQGKDKQPLSLDQDSSLLKDQQVFLELRVTFAVKVAFTGKTVAVVVKSNKTLQDALATMLTKYRLRPQDATVTMSGSGHVISLNTPVTLLANKTLILDKAVDKASSSKGITSPPSIHDRRGGVDANMFPTGISRSTPRQRNPGLRKTYDMEGLVELMNRAQCCSADDQRGLLKKEHLMLPQFLQLPLEDVDETETCKSLEESCSSMSSLETVSPAEPDPSEKGPSTKSDCSNPARETMV
ncbi:regulator of G-protein signaling 14 isoform X3 [Misgurnus anguillicaudatus]|nr:regulator of G-protein signaling 14 isoform X3 [Misgurnus anguillicaudatus]XP_055035469.1 regulator of G-protein signaling 14 isoform X3 [Misgurnus anguillicaudatus]XP_055035470.1 regulator of G-protein signaling 14 isoform X3 [Misgurnus anguillicaudatus]